MLFVMNSAAISCDTEVLGAGRIARADGIARAGDKLVIDAAPSALCQAVSCSPKIVAFIKLRIQSRLRSISFTLNVALSDGTFVLVVVKFCLFGSGKRCKS